MNYVIIGMPGSGKTTIGKLLADKLNYDFIDSDHYLESLFDETIPQMFAK
ncbi:MAG TPA: AAA family ATPase, partial [Clostridiaceae bacterium]|nr:AAA family ATPase [Clostridiaceae bacterium]